MNKIGTIIRLLCANGYEIKIFQHPANINFLAFNLAKCGYTQQAHIKYSEFEANAGDCLNDMKQKLDLHIRIRKGL